jgi:hypothetical protein
MNCELCQTTKQQLEYNGELKDFGITSFTGEVYNCSCPELFYEHLAKCKTDGKNVMATPNNREIFKHMVEKKKIALEQIEPLEMKVPNDIKDEDKRERFLSNRADIRADIKKIDDNLWYMIYN